MVRIPTVCFIGEPVLDQYVSVDHLPAVGDKASFSSVTSHAGGTVANAAFTCHAFGARVEMIGAITSGPASEQLLAELAAEGIGTTSLESVVGRSEPVCFVISAPTGSVVLYPDRSNEQFTLSAQMLEKLGQADVIVTAGEKLVRVKNKDALRAAFARCRARGGQILVDFDTGEGLEQLLSDLGEVSVVLMNEFAAPRLFPGSGTIPSMEVVRSHLPDVESFIVTLGANGAVLRGAVAAQVPGIAVDVVDTVGAGDAFVGALAYAMAQQWPLAQGMEFANQVAAHVVTLTGPRLQNMPAGLENLTRQFS